MMSRRGAAILIATAAVVFAACSSGGASTAPSSAASAAGVLAPRPRPSASAPPSRSTGITSRTTTRARACGRSWPTSTRPPIPNVKVNLTVLENEAFKTKLTTLLQAGTPPDLFQSWGGGGLREQQKAGLVKDISADVSSWASEINPGAMGMYQVDGKQYGIPFDLGMVGFWYNKSQFAKAGITAPPATWDDLLADVGKLKTAGVTPFALAGKDTWTGAFFWAYLAVRECGKAGMDKAVTTGDWSDPCFVKAGADFKKLIDLKPFQQGFLAAPWDGAGSGAAAMAKGDGAIQLMGQWLPGHGQRQLRRQEGHGRQPRLVPVPGRGRRAPVTPTDGLGGGNGFAVGKDAPPETVDFLHFLVSKDAANRWGALNTGILPITVGTESSVTDPQLTSVLAARAKANFVQLYLDQATTPALGGSINDAVATLYAGSGTPESVASAIATAAKTQ